MPIDNQLLGLLIVCLLIFIAHFKRRGGIHAGDPVVLLLVMFSLGTAVKLIYFLWFRAKHYTESLNVLHDPVMMGKTETFLVDGMFFITISIAAYCVASVNRYRFKLVVPCIRFNERRLTSLSLWGCAITVTGLFLFLYQSGAFQTGEYFAKRFNELPGGATHRFFSTQYWLFKGISSIKYFFYAIVIYLAGRDGRAGRRIYVLIGLTLVLTMLVFSVVGSRAQGFVMVLDLIVIGAVGFSRRRAILFSVLIGLVILFTGTTIITRYEGTTDPAKRESNVSRAVREQTVAAEIAAERGGHERLDPERVERSLWFKDLVGDERAKKIDVLIRGRYFLDLFKTSHIVDEVPERMPYLHGESLYGWVFVLVPRSVWPGKPVFAELPSILAERIFLEPSNNVPPGLIGEAWLNFGWFGILVVVLVGGAMGASYNFFLEARANEIVQVLYVMVLTRVSFVAFNTSLGDAVLKIILDCGPLIVLLLLVSSPMRQAESRNLRDERGDRE